MAESTPPRPKAPAGLFSELNGFKNSKLKPTETVERTNFYVPRGAGKKPTETGAETAHKNDEDITEFQDTLPEMKKKAAELAKLLCPGKTLLGRRKKAKVVVYTGAGVSTAAKIPDYRGPKGIWTLAAKGQKLPPMSLEAALPTYTHMAIKKLVDEGIVTMVVSTNVDGLHLRSGIPEKKIAELHGNVYKETCPGNCKTYFRPFNVTTNARQRFTGRLCEVCDQRLKDSIVNFGESLPADEMFKAERHSTKADLSLVIGTSMRVSPACNIPGLCKGPLVILNLQKTPFDGQAAIRVFSKCDEFFRLVMENLGMDVPAFDETAYAQRIAEQARTMKNDPTFESIEKYPGINKPLGDAQHNELLGKVLKIKATTD